MREVVINRCYGGFSLSLKASKAVIERKGLTPVLKEEGRSWAYYTTKEDDRWSCRDVQRHDPDLVAVVKELGKKANGDCAELQIYEVHGRYRIEEYDGMESVEEEGSYSGWR